MRAIALAFLLVFGLTPASQAQDLPTTPPSVTMTVGGEQARLYSPVTWRIETDEETGETVAVFTSQVALNTLGKSVKTGLESYAAVGLSPEQEITLLRKYVEELQQRIDTLTKDVEKEREQKIVELRKIWCNRNQQYRKVLALEAAAKRTQAKTTTQTKKAVTDASDYEIDVDQDHPVTFRSFSERAEEDSTGTAGTIDNHHDFPKSPPTPTPTPSGTTAQTGKSGTHIGYWVTGTLAVIAVITLFALIRKRRRANKETKPGRLILKQKDFDTPYNPTEETSWLGRMTARLIRPLERLEKRLGEVRSGAE